MAFINNEQILCREKIELFPNIGLLNLKGERLFTNLIKKYIVTLKGNFEILKFLSIGQTYSVKLNRYCIDINQERKSKTHFKYDCILISGIFSDEGELVFESPPLN